MNLYEATKTVHHQAQLHTFGKRLAGGKVTANEWCDWLGAMFQLYQKLDPYLPECLRRCPDLMLDLVSLAPIHPHHSLAVDAYISWANDKYFDHNVRKIGGLAYLMAGANLRGGQLIRKQMEPQGFSCKHLKFTPKNKDLAENWLLHIREFSELAQATNKAFTVLIEIMDEIEMRYSDAAPVPKDTSNYGLEASNYGLAA